MSGLSVSIDRCHYLVSKSGVGNRYTSPMSIAIYSVYEGPFNPFFLFSKAPLPERVISIPTAGKCLPFKNRRGEATRLPLLCLACFVISIWALQAGGEKHGQNKIRKP